MAAAGSIQIEMFSSSWRPTSAAQPMFGMRDDEKGDRVGSFSG